MDSARAYASDHAPAITLAGSEARGIAQGGVALKGGVGFDGRIVIAGDAGALGRHRGLGALLALALEPVGAFLQLGRALRSRAKREGAGE